MKKQNKSSLKKQYVQLEDDVKELLQKKADKHASKKDSPVKPYMEKVLIDHAKK